MAKKNGTETKKVSKKKLRTARWKWLKVLWHKIDELEERLQTVEEFLGGRESMKKVIEERKCES